MTDIIRMAREAGFTDASFCRWSAYTDDLERFAALVAAAAVSEWERKQAEPVMDAIQREMRIREQRASSWTQRAACRPTTARRTACRRRRTKS